MISKLIFFLTFSVAVSAQFLSNSGKPDNITFGKAEFLNTGMPEAASKKSVPMAVLYSFLLPGMGEYYASSYTSGKYFTYAEASFWLVYFGMERYAVWQADNYKSYAKATGKVSSTDFDNDYYGNVGNYMSVDEFNDEMSFQRRYEKMYDANKYYWKWDSNADRRTYRGMWVASQQANNSLRFVVGAMILNRVASAVNAARLVVRYNKNLNTENSVSLYFQPEVSPGGGMSANLTIGF